MRLWNGQRIVPVGGVDVPADPIAPVGVFLSREAWDHPADGMLTMSAFASVTRTPGVMKVERRGPRGGRWWAIADEWEWRRWRDQYVARCEARAVGEAKRRLDGTYSVHYTKRGKKR